MCLLALTVSQGIPLCLFKHQNAMGSGNGVSIGRMVCEANAVPNLSYGSSDKKVVRVCMALPVGLHLSLCGFFIGKPWQHLFKQ